MFMINPEYSFTHQPSLFCKVSYTLGQGFLHIILTRNVSHPALLQSSVSHDPTEIIIIWYSRNIYDYYSSWKQFFTFLFQDSLKN